MKNLVHLGAFLSCALFTTSINAQTTFSSSETIDAGNIDAIVSVHGDMWLDPSSNAAHCEFPKNSGKKIGGSGALWMAGYDDQSNLHVSGQVYRTATVADYWPAPLDPSGAAVSYAVSQDWARIWKVEVGEVNLFLNISNHTVGNTPVSILEWPANGNPYAKGNNNVALTINTDMAPFVDVNNDGQYNPLQGDYPAIKGDQMLWYVFNDNGATHNASNGSPIMAEVKCTVYAYGRGTLADNILYYEYEITNHNASTLHSFVLAMFADLDVGYAWDDYIGFDSSRDLGILYNAQLYDGVAGTTSVFHDTIPKVGIKVLRMPGDTCGVLSPAGSFMFINNGFDARVGDPTVDTEFNNYMRSSFRNGDTLMRLLPPLFNTGTPEKYVCPDDPSIPGGWSECADGYPPYDRRMVVASEPFTFNAGETVKFAFALVASNPSYQNACPNTSFADIQQVADTAQFLFCNPLPVITDIDDVPQDSKLVIYPNPATDHIVMEGPIQEIAQLKLTDALGRSFSINPVRTAQRIEISTAHLAPGVYYLSYYNGTKTMHSSFVKK